MKTLLLAGTVVAVLAVANLASAMAQQTKRLSQVVQWTRSLLVIVRTPRAHHSKAACGVDVAGCLRSSI